MAAAVSLALQVGVNFANDYSDGVRGTDDVRVGPTRLVASGLAKAGEVKSAALVSFGVAAACGLTLAVATSWWLLAVGASSILAAWFYTGGPRPYGYLGLGEVFVFTFFGLVATIGTTYVTIERMPVESWIFGCVAGFLACALLVTNNLRDIPGDAAVGKRTLAVRIGSRHTRHLFVALLGASFLAIVISGFVRPGAFLGLVSVPLAVRPARRILSGADGRDLIAVLGETGRVQIAAGITVSVGVMLFG
jgi:1,4-dihydroxy-2-naphthoate polyprenyltransferase